MVAAACVHYDQEVEMIVCKVKLALNELYEGTQAANQVNITYRTDDTVQGVIKLTGVVADKDYDKGDLQLVPVKHINTASHILFQDFSGSRDYAIMC